MSADDLWERFVYPLCIVLLVVGLVVGVFFVGVSMHKAVTAPVVEDTVYVIYNDKNEVVREIGASRHYYARDGMIKLYTSDHIEFLQLGEGWRMEIKR